MAVLPSARPVSAWRRRAALALAEARPMPGPAELVTELLNGVVLGLLYALIASGSC